MTGRQTNGNKSSNRTNSVKSSANKSSTQTRSTTGNTTRKSGTKSSSAAYKKTGTSGTKKRSKKNQRSQIQDEITVLIVLACALILMFSNFNLAGNVGQSIKWFTFGMIGVIEYIFPIIMAVILLFLVSNKNIIAVARIKSAAAAVLAVMCAAAWQIITDNPSVESTDVFEFFTYCAENKCGGGIVGGIFGKLLEPFGFWGSMVVIVIVSIICMVLITEKSFIKSLTNMKNSGSEFVRNAKRDYDEYKEYSEQNFEENIERADLKKQKKAMLREEKRQKKELQERLLKEKQEKANERMQKKALGVTKDTTLVRESIPQGESIDIKEITVDMNRKDKYSADIYIPETVEVKTEDNITAKEEPLKLSFDSSVDSIEKVQDYSCGAFASGSGESANSEKGLASDERISAEALHVRESHKNDQSESNMLSEDRKYVFPPMDLLTKASGRKNGMQNSSSRETAMRLQQTLQNFGVKVTVTDISCGPSVTRYELQPESGVKVSKIVSLADDIKLNLAAADIRIEAPIPGKAAVGIEVPNKEKVSVGLRELLESDEFRNSPSAITFAAGKDIGGKTIVADIAKMPHMLIAGATGSGKSVCINTIIMSILYKADPEDVKLIMVDPKVVELSVYNGIPHLLTPVVTDPKKASGALNWAVAEMTDRYKKFAQMGVRDLKGYNQKISRLDIADGEERPSKLPQIVIIIDELADLMMVAANEVEDAICRLAQLARACGIHLIIATQRPSVNVITGLIKANVPSKIAFSVASGVDSRIILDMNGAEKLLGRGDMLFFPAGYPKPIRVQGAFVSDEEVSAVVEYLKNQSAQEVVYNEEIVNTMEAPSEAERLSENERDAYFAEAARFVVEKEKASIGMLQRYYKIGFNRAGRIVDQLADAGIVGPEVGTKPRKILMSMEEVEMYLQGLTNNKE